MSLLTAAALLCVASPQSDELTPPQFSPPIRLMSEDNPLGRKKMYPSPRLYDIDRDGQDELVIGDLPGRVTVAEKVQGAGPAQWGPLEPFMSGKRALKFRNW